MRLGSSSKPQLPVRHTIREIKIRYSTGHSVASVSWILCCGFLHPLVPTKCPSVSSASGEKNRKASTLKMKPKIITQLQANVSVLSTLKAGRAEL